jgi:hypothetical protein
MIAAADDLRAGDDHARAGTIAVATVRNDRDLGGAGAPADLDVALDGARRRTLRGAGLAPRRRRALGGAVVATLSLHRALGSARCLGLRGARCLGGRRGARRLGGCSSRSLDGAGRLGCVLGRRRRLGVGWCCLRRGRVFAPTLGASLGSRLRGALDVCRARRLGFDARLGPDLGTRLGLGLGLDGLAALGPLLRSVLGPRLRPRLDGASFDRMPGRRRVYDRSFGSAHDGSRRRACRCLSGRW